MRTVCATRYVTPLREGGSMPGLVEADDDGLYVLKFRAAGQGVKALVAELVAGEIGRALGLPVPELVLVELDPEIGRAEPDPEIQHLLRGSPGTNLGMDFLPGALAYGPAPEPRLAPGPAADVVWFDALVTNVDRTPRNPNLLVWHDRLWLIDHGAALYAHHGSGDPVSQAASPFAAIRDHVLLGIAASITDADARLAGRLGTAEIEAIVAEVPDAFLDGDPAARRRAHVDYLLARLAPPRAFAEEAERARAAA